MTEIPQLPESVEETLALLRRFAGMLSGPNSDNLFRAVFLIEDLSHDLKIVSDAFDAEQKSHAIDLDRCKTAEAKVAELTSRLKEVALQLDAEQIQSKSAVENHATERKALEARIEQAERERDRLASEIKQGVLVPLSQLNLALTQFKGLAREFHRKGDIASQVMCEIGYRAIDRAIAATPANTSAKEGREG